MPEFRIDYTEEAGEKRSAKIYMADELLGEISRGDDESEALLIKMASNARWMARQVWTALNPPSET